MSEKVRVVIADDERPARLYLTKLLQTFQDVELLGEAEHGPAAVELIKRTKPDLALLDLQMPGLDGLAVARSFQKEPRPLIVFVTAHDKFAVSAFEVEAFDFLLKPIDRGRLRDLFSRALKRLELIDLLEEGPSPARAGGAGNGSDRRYLERIPVKQKENILLLPVSQIASIVADGELLYVSTVKRERYCINHRLKSLERRLDPARFIRLGRGTLVNIQMINHVTPMPGGVLQLTLINAEQLLASRAQSRILRKHLLGL